MFTFIGDDLLVHYIYIISVLRQRRRSFLLDWGGGGGGEFERCKKKKLARFARKFAIANFSRMARRIIENFGIFVKFDGLVVQDGAFELFLHCMMPPPPPPPRIDASV